MDRHKTTGKGSQSKHAVHTLVVVKVPDTRKILNCSGVRHSFHFSLNRQNVIIIDSKSINWSDANECKDFT